MRRLTLQAQPFKDFVFPQVATGTSENEGEFETALRLIRKLKDPALTAPADLSDAEKEAEKRGEKVYKFYHLREDEATFELEEDEHALLLKRLRANRTRVATLAAEDFHALLEVVAKAPTGKVETPAEERGK